MGEVKTLVGWDDEPNLIVIIVWLVISILLNSLTWVSISCFNIKGHICVSPDVISTVVQIPLINFDYSKIATIVLTMLGSNPCLSY